MKKIHKIISVTLDSSRLYANSADTPNGIVHVSIARMAEDEDGTEYVRDGGDAYIGDADITGMARALWEAIAQRYADRNATDVRASASAAAALVAPRIAGASK